MSTTFNESELLERVDNDIGFLAETVQMLESDGQTLLADIEKAIASGDAAAVGRAAHALKGMVSNFCAPETQECALAIERAGKAGDLAAAPAALRTAKARVEALTAELVAFVKARS